MAGKLSLARITQKKPFLHCQDGLQMTSNGFPRNLLTGNFLYAPLQGLPMLNFQVSILTIGNAGVVYQVKATNSREAANLGQWLALDAGLSHVRVVSVCQQ
jgi:hypothetical protein